MSKNSEDTAPEETTYFPILDANSLLNFLVSYIFIYFWSYISPWTYDLDRAFMGRTSLCPEERYRGRMDNFHSSHDLVLPGSFSHVLAIPERARDQGTEPRRGIGGWYGDFPSQLCNSLLIFQRMRPCRAAQRRDLMTTLGPLYLSVLWFPPLFVSTDVCSDVRQLFKGHFRIKSIFYSVISINSSEVISQLNIHGMTRANTPLLRSIFSMRLLFRKLKIISHNYFYA